FPPARPPRKRTFSPQAPRRQGLGKVRFRNPWDTPRRPETNFGHPGRAWAGAASRATRPLPIDLEATDTEARQRGRVGSQEASAGRRRLQGVAPPPRHDGERRLVGGL